MVKFIFRPHPRNDYVFAIPLKGRVPQQIRLVQKVQEFMLSDAMLKALSNEEVSEKEYKHCKNEKEKVDLYNEVYAMRNYQYLFVHLLEMVNAVRLMKKAMLEEAVDDQVGPAVAEVKAGNKESSATLKTSKLKPAIKKVIKRLKRSGDIPGANKRKLKNALKHSIQKMLPKELNWDHLDEGDDKDDHDSTKGDDELRPQETNNYLISNIQFD